MRVLESDRIVLKPIEEEDLPLLLELRWDETLTADNMSPPTWA